MSEEAGEIAAAIASITAKVQADRPDTLKVVITEHGPAARAIVNLLVKAHGLGRSDIVQLGVRSTDERVAGLLEQRKPIVILPVGILRNFRCLFHPPETAAEAFVINGLDGQVGMLELEAPGEPFELEPGDTGFAFRGA